MVGAGGMGQPPLHSLDSSACGRGPGPCSTLAPSSAPTSTCPPLAQHRTPARTLGPLQGPSCLGGSADPLQPWSVQGSAAACCPQRASAAPAWPRARAASWDQTGLALPSLSRLHLTSALAGGPTRASCQPGLKDSSWRPAASCRVFLGDSRLWHCSPQPVCASWAGWHLDQNRLQVLPACPQGLPHQAGEMLS